MENIIIVGILAGVITGYLLAWAIFQKRMRIITEEQTRFLEGYEKSELYEQMRTELSRKQDEVVKLSGEVNRQAAIITNQEQRAIEERSKLDEVKNQFTMEFQNLANRIFEEKSKSMSAANAEKLEAIIRPFDKRIQEFGRRVEETYVRGTQERSSLKEQLRHLMETNNQLSQDAIKLTEALKGDSQFQGSWGEIRLKRLLEKS